MVTGEAGGRGKGHEDALGLEGPAGVKAFLVPDRADFAERDWGEFGHCTEEKTC